MKATALLSHRKDRRRARSSGTLLDVGVERAGDHLAGAFDLDEDLVGARLGKTVRERHRRWRRGLMHRVRIRIRHREIDRGHRRRSRWMHVREDFAIALYEH